MLSKCPRYFNHGPAIEIWSVVHLPFALINNFKPFKSVPSQAANGASNCKRSEVGFTFTSTPLPSSNGAMKPASSTAKPLTGSSSPVGGSNFTCSPFSLVNVSVKGLKVRSPAIAKAVVSSGEATNAKVFGFPSWRLAKLRLKECTIVLRSCLSAPWRAHMPMQGPQALAYTVAPILLKVSIKPSRSIVKRICSEPGVMLNSAFDFRFFAATCLARDTEREISS